VPGLIGPRCRQGRAAPEPQIEAEVSPCDTAPIIPRQIESEAKAQRCRRVSPFLEMTSGEGGPCSLSGSSFSCRLQLVVRVRSEYGYLEEMAMMLHRSESCLYLSSSEMAMTVS
jgi:hypothetical protein